MYGIASILQQGFEVRDQHTQSVGRPFEAFTVSINQPQHDTINVVCSELTP